MTRIRIKRVYEAPAPDDGCRVLVDRLWPRGVRRDALHCDVWARDLAPSAGLRSWYHADPGDRWEEFRRRYTDELRASQAVEKLWDAILKTSRVTGDPIQAWNDHNKDLNDRCEYLNNLHIRELRYKSS